MNTVKTFLLIIFLVVSVIGCELPNSEPSADDVRIMKIIRAKDYVRSNVAQYPDTLDFHSWSYEPTVSGDTVTLKFTCKNAFGVPETHVMDIEI